MSLGMGDAGGDKFPCAIFLATYAARAPGQAQSDLVLDLT